MNSGIDKSQHKTKAGKRKKKESVDDEASVHWLFDDCL